jgi:hypothetical protein
VAETTAEITRREKARGIEFFMVMVFVIGGDDRSRTMVAASFCDAPGG